MLQLAGVAAAALAPVVVGLFGLLLPAAGEQVVAERQRATRCLVETAVSLLATHHALAEQGVVAEEAAKQTALEELRRLRYDNGNYFWVQDFGPTMRMHPTQPSLEGRDLSGYRDGNGTALFLQFVDLCRAHGEGFVAYAWPRPGEAHEVSKLSFGKLFVPWGWIVGGGIYLDDVAAEVAALRDRAGLLSGGALLAAVCFGLLASRWLDVRLRKQELLLQVIRRTQGGFILAENPHQLFHRLLDGLLQVTGSEYGFIGEVHASPQGVPFLRTLAITNLAWDEATRAFYAEHRQRGLEFHNLATLYGPVLRDKAAVFSNRPATDPRSSGLPDGHPPLHSFLGVPLLAGDTLLGMFGLANRCGGYRPQLLEHLAPLTESMANLLVARRAAADRCRAETEQARLVDELQDALSRVETLSGLLPICAACKRIRDEGGRWHAVESYIQGHSRAEFTHGMCPDCVAEYYPGYTADGHRHNPL